MSELRTLIDCLYEQSRSLLTEAKAFYRQNYQWLTPQQRQKLEARIEELTQVLYQKPRRHESLPHRAVGKVLDAFYYATYGLVGKLLPPRQKS